MEIEITSQNENKVLNRNEIKFFCDYEGDPTPTILEVKSKLVALLDSKKELVVVDNLKPHFGEPKALGYAKVYDSEEDLKSIETKSVIEKNTEPEAAPAEEEAEE